MVTGSMRAASMVSAQFCRACVELIVFMYKMYIIFILPASSTAGAVLLLGESPKNRGDHGSGKDTD
jgi:hypothetical protein